MKKILFPILIFGILLTMSNCNNEPENNEPNPYPDGVYPFEVSKVSHTEDAHLSSITWTPPADSGFSRVNVEMGIIFNSNQERRYPPDPSTPSYIANMYRDFVLTKNTFSFYSSEGGDKYIIIKCVDKFGNVSEGVKYLWTD